LLELLVRKVESLEGLVGERVAARLQALENQVKGLSAILAKQRKEHFTVEEVAELTGRSSYTVRRWITEKKLRAIRLRDGGPRGRLLIPRTELDQLIAAGQGHDIPSTALD